MVLVNGWNYSLDPESIKASWDPLHWDVGFGIHINVDEIYAWVSGRKYPLWKLNFSWPCFAQSKKLKCFPPIASFTQGTVITVIIGIVKHYLFLVGVIAKDASFQNSLNCFVCQQAQTLVDFFFFPNWEK